MKTAHESFKDLIPEFFHELLVVGFKHPLQNGFFRWHGDGGGHDDHFLTASHAQGRRDQMPCSRHWARLGATARATLGFPECVHRTDRRA